MKQICADLRAEYDALDQVVSGLDADGWSLKVPFLHWDVHYEIAHIAYFDGTGRLAATDPEAFGKHVEHLLANLDNWDDIFSEVNGKGDDELLNYWRDERNALLAALEPLAPKDRLPWYGPPMSARSFTTARLMETWAHGQDIYDALRIKREPTDRLQHIAHLGVTTYGWSFMVHGQEKPDVQIRVELAGPGGQLWTWGPEDADESINGDAQDFCLVVTQRRNIDDTGLAVKGDAARKWMEVAQCFAGPPADGPAPGVRAW